MCASLSLSLRARVSQSFIESIHRVFRLRIGRSQFLKLPLPERRTRTMTLVLGSRDTQRDASSDATVVCHF